MINYFKVSGYESVGSNRSEEPSAADIKERVTRILQSPPQRINWGQYFFFDDESEESARTAFVKALTLAGGNTRRIHVARYIYDAGPWSKVNVIGEPYPADN